MVELSKQKSKKISYCLKSNCGTVLDQVDGPDGIQIDLDDQSLPLSLRQSLSERKPGDTYVLNLTAEDAYGERDEDLVTRVSRSQFEGVPNLTPGMQLESRIDGELEIAWVREIEDESVVIDLNHPLAGVDVCFEVHVL